jgi:hypothetical protein
MTASLAHVPNLQRENELRGVAGLGLDPDCSLKMRLDTVGLLSKLFLCRLLRVTKR